MVTAIDWSRLARAVEFYKACGYRYVELPWAVDDRIVAITAPHEHWRSQVKGLGSLVGSAEQAFLSLDAMGALDKDLYCALTPCFRVAEDPAQAETHQQHFMKVELFSNNGGPRERILDRMIDDAHRFFQSEKRPADDLQIVPGDEAGTFDLEINGVEVGSYGCREARLEDVHIVDKLELYANRGRVIGAFNPKPTFFHAEEMERAELAERPAYRITTARDLQWVYATGLAEPRFSYACSRETRTPLQRARDQARF